MFENFNGILKMNGRDFMILHSIIFYFQVPDELELRIKIRSITFIIKKNIK